MSNEIKKDVVAYLKRHDYRIISKPDKFFQVIAESTTAENPHRVFVKITTKEHGVRNSLFKRHDKLNRLSKNRVICVTDKSMFGYSLYEYFENHMTKMKTRATLEPRQRCKEVIKRTDMGDYTKSIFVQRENEIIRLS